MSLTIHSLTFMYTQIYKFFHIDICETNNKMVMFEKKKKSINENLRVRENKNIKAEINKYLNIHGCRMRKIYV